MNIVYILQSLKNGRYYIGSTNNIERRLQEHNSGKTKSLQYLLPIELKFTYTCQTISEARKLELRLKKLKSRKILDTIVKNNNLGPIVQW